MTAAARLISAASRRYLSAVAWASDMGRAGIVRSFLLQPLEHACIRFRAHLRVAASGRHARPPEKGAAMRAKRILLVEDELGVRDLLALVLYSAGYVVDVASIR